MQTGCSHKLSLHNECPLPPNPHCVYNRLSELTPCLSLSTATVAHNVQVTAAHSNSLYSANFSLVTGLWPYSSLILN
jgi:hypothetical protein